MWKTLENTQKLCYGHSQSLIHKFRYGSPPAIRIRATTTPYSKWQDRRDAFTAYCGEASCVFRSQNLPTIFVGSALNASCNSMYTRDKDPIDCVLNCAKFVKCFGDSLFLYQHIQLHDDANQHIDFSQDTSFQNTLSRFLHRVLNDSNHHTILIHCEFGRSRSVALTILIMFLFYKHQNVESKSMADIYREIHRARPVVYINQNFYNSLLQFEETFQANAEVREKWMSLF